MLNSLHIENLAVIKSIDVDFTKGFTVLSGETGAGKSIIIDSINLLIGAKADKELIRTGESSAMVSGVFSALSDSAIVAISELGISPDEEGNILIQRVVSTDGRSNIKVNGRSVTLGVLKLIGAHLVSIHGQSDTMTLTDSENQLELLDVYSNNNALLSEYKEAYSALEALRREMTELSAKESERVRLIEILRYQIEDIASHSLHAGEEEELVERKVKIKNSEKISKNAGFAFKALKGSEKGGVTYLLDKTVSALSQISDVIPKFSEYSESLRDILYQVDDIAEEIYSEISGIDEDSDDAINEIESRLDKISKLKRKYGYTVSEILDFKAKAEAELEILENSDSHMKKLEKEEKEAYEKALAIADKLHERRRDSALKIEKSVKETLEFLDMPKVVFFVSLKESINGERKVLCSTGSDSAEFYISANRGAEPQPLSKVASGGELARVMLALKSVIADKDGVSAIIFDEIDAGVSGKTARKIGIKMLSLSKTAQIFSVTHSAQIASLGDTHYLISKSDVSGKTETNIRILDREGRVDELSRILGGIDVTEAQRKAAIDMLDEKGIYTE